MSRAEPRPRWALAARFAVPFTGMVVGLSLIGWAVLVESFKLAPHGLLAAIALGLVWWNGRVLSRSEADRRRADRIARDGEQFYHLLVESIPQNILRKDREGRFTFANTRCQQTFGRTMETLAGMTDYDLFPIPLAEAYREDDLRVMTTGQVIDQVEEHIAADGQTYAVQVVKTPLYDAEGQVIGVQGIFWDVTARKRAQEQLQAQNERLQEMARSERQAHEERKQAQSRMVQSAKLAGLGQMVAGVAHEINNPLSFVGNNVAVLQRDLAELAEAIALYHQADDLLAEARPQLWEQLRSLAERADLEYSISNLPGLLSRTREGLGRIQRIVRDLRVFARLDESELDEVDLNAGIESTVTIINGHAKGRQVRVVADLAPLPRLSCYSARINQVVMNLIANAIDACTEGGTVTVRTRAEGQGVKVEVQDDGEGIDPAVRERIFDPFFTTKPVGVGTGLGLSISYGIVQDHGGTIEVESAPGRGSTFVVTLPQCRPPARWPTPQPAEAAR